MGNTINKRIDHQPHVTPRFLEIVPSCVCDHVFVLVFVVPRRDPCRIDASPDVNGGHCYFRRNGFLDGNCGAIDRKCPSCMDDHYCVKTVHVCQLDIPLNPSSASTRPLPPTQHRRHGPLRHGSVVSCCW